LNVYHHITTINIFRSAAAEPEAITTTTTTNGSRRTRSIYNNNNKRQQQKRDPNKTLARNNFVLDLYNLKKPAKLNIHIPYSQ